MPSNVSNIQDEKLKGKLRCVVVTPEKAILDTVVDFIVVPMFDGELGVLPGRAPIIGRLGAGELRLKTGTTAERYFVEAGFVQVRSNVVTVLTSHARKAAEVTTDLATKAAADAEALPSGNVAERANKAKARDLAAGMKRVAARNASA
ncbi:MAG: ATP synthase F1 subunit epsilon [Planctomycetaceae bacterium]|nr:ATP synthase F1 subunit epsilon [Planctomycetaceae bacterium]